MDLCNVCILEPMFCLILTSFLQLRVLKKIYDFKYLKVIVAFKGLLKEFIFLFYHTLPENTLYHNFTLVPKRYHFFSTAVKLLFISKF